MAGLCLVAPLGIGAVLAAHNDKVAYIVLEKALSFIGSFGLVGAVNGNVQLLLKALEILIAPAKRHVGCAGALFDADREVERINAVALKMLADSHPILKAGLAFHTFVVKQMHADGNGECSRSLAADLCYGFGNDAAAVFKRAVLCLCGVVLNAASGHLARSLTEAVVHR